MIISRNSNKRTCRVVEKVEISIDRIKNLLPIINTISYICREAKLVREITNINKKNIMWCERICMFHIVRRAEVHSGICQLGASVIIGIEVVVFNCWIRVFEFVFAIA